jgi:hypothetical protein
VNDGPRPESVAARIVDTGINLSYRAAEVNFRGLAPVYGSRGSVTYVTGSHAMKAGFNLVGASSEMTPTSWATGYSPR